MPQNNIYIGNKQSLSSVSQNVEEYKENLSSSIVINNLSNNANKKVKEKKGKGKKKEGKMQNIFESQGKVRESNGD